MAKPPFLDGLCLSLHILWTIHTWLIWNKGTAWPESEYFIGDTSIGLFFLMLLFSSGLLTTWLQCYAMWPKIVDGKGISGSIDTNWFKPTFTLAIRHNAPVRSVRKSCLYIQNIFLFFSFQVLRRLRYDFPGLLLHFLQSSSSWLKILMVEKLIVKNLSTLGGL